MNLNLNLLAYQQYLKYKQFENGQHIWDSVRQKYVRAFPEELVRQLLVYYLINEKKYTNHIAVEKQIKLFEQVKRFDVLLYNSDFEPAILVECKAAFVELNQDVFNQISVYNLHFKVPYLIISNGINTYCAELNFETQTYIFLNAIPDFKQLIINNL